MVTVTKGKKKRNEEGTMDIVEGEFAFVVKGVDVGVKNEGN